MVVEVDESVERALALGVVVPVADVGAFFDEGVVGSLGFIVGLGPVGAGGLVGGAGGGEGRFERVGAVAGAVIGEALSQAKPSCANQAAPRCQKAAAVAPLSLVQASLQAMRARSSKPVWMYRQPTAQCLGCGASPRRCMRQPQPAGMAGSFLTSRCASSAGWSRA